MCPRRNVCFSLGGKNLRGTTTALYENTRRLFQRVGWLADFLGMQMRASQPARRRRILGVGRGVHPELHPKLLFRPKEETIVLRFLGLKRGETKFESLEVPDWIAAICRQREVWRVVELGVCVCVWV